jgi:sugar phosphate isomerase/epimerase
MNVVTRRMFLGAVPAAGATALLAPTFVGAADVPASAPRKFQLGTVTYNVCKDWDLPTILKVCKSVGLAAVELRTTHKHGVETTLSADQRAEVKKRFADAGVTCWGLGSVCEFHSPDQSTVEKHIETCKQFVQLAADIGGRGVKVRPNGLPKGVPVEKTLEQIGKALIACGKAAADAGVEIWVEVHGGGTSLPANMKAIMEHCGHASVGVTWNSNATDVVKGSVADAFAMLKPWIKSCHINDIYKDQSGAYPYRELFRLMRECGYDRVTLIEIGKAWPNPDDGAEMLRYYKALWHELSKAG